MLDNSDVLIIGAGPAGASAAILLAQAGWRVSLVEQHAYPRQKVCGGCIAAGNFELLDELGIGPAVRHAAGAELTRVGWMHGAARVTADMPPCIEGADRYGRALGRDILDTLLLSRARSLGVCVVQPARVRTVWGGPGAFRCDIENLGRSSDGPSSSRNFRTLSASIIIDAHGSWEAAPQFGTGGGAATPSRRLQRGSDLFAFKATFAQAALTAGMLPVLALNGGYGGMVVANDGGTIVAVCLRRDALRTVRAKKPGLPVGIAVENFLRESCEDVGVALLDAQRIGSWRTVGPLRPGVRSQATPGIFNVGNASGESHPLIGEGISMALQSSKLLVTSLLRHADRTTLERSLALAQRNYARAWRKSFLPRIRLAAFYAHIAMRSSLNAPVAACLTRWPALLTTAARLAGKARPVIHPSRLREETS